jgi:hypothetical protein
MLFYSFFLKKLVSNDFISLTETFWFSAWYLMSNEIQNCIKYMDDRLVTQFEALVYETTNCLIPSGTDQWKQDPC